MTGNDRRTGVDPDGIRTLDQGPGRRAARVRRIVLSAAVVTILVVAITTTALVELRRQPAVPAERTVPVASRETPGGAPKKVVRAPSIPPQDVPAADRAREPAPTRAGPDATPPSTATGADRSLEGLVRNVYEGLGSHGDGEGIAAFPPKGTNPPKPGLIVPEDFQLPEGYVRYYQVTDEGQRLDPILMFSPDYEFVDASGKPIALPADGIVPPEMAPPGLPVRMLEIPPDARATPGGR